ncbi:MAG: hypothetical protein UU98_C0023G0002 [Parcubacteria group bacterium GW2011_GWD2_42_14]|nr:MAG: hypothetical protein UU98_C0023G0002 [Parcubacteria group bacterium GW2011_GWD2_42_14]
MLGIGAIVILLLVLGYYVMTSLTRVETPQDLPAETVTVTSDFKGVVTSVNLEQIIADGPALIQFTTDAGTNLTIALPSMGSLLCSASDSVASAGSIEVGARIEVRGETSDEGYLVPCDDTSHYLRVIE